MMGSPDLFKTLTPELKEGDSFVLMPKDVRLTPQLSIVVAILYMMSVDGEISDRESSQLQAVIGSDAALLRRAVKYAESHDVDEFLKTAPSLLNPKVRLCLLTNVCDSLMADGQLADAEVNLFDRLLAAFGHTAASFQSCYDTIAIKDRTSVLGDFDIIPSEGAVNPPLALVVSLLYMMSADGSMAEEEIGRLSVIVGSSQGLLKAGLRYVGKVRVPQFLASAVSMLDKTQRLCILLNVCDAMMSDRNVDDSEAQLFKRMLAGFGFEAKSFDTYLNIIRLKNDIPQDEAHLRETVSNEGVVFERKRTWKEDVGNPGEAASQERQGAHHADFRDEPASELGSSISRTIQGNIDRLADQIGAGASIGTMEKNARDGDDLPSDRTVAGEGLSELRMFRDAEATLEPDHASGHGEATFSRQWQDAALSGERRDTLGTTLRLPALHLIDNYQTTDKQTINDSESPKLIHVIGVRMDAVRQRNRTIRDYLEPWLNAKSIATASRLPVVPALPIKHSAASSLALSNPDGKGHSASIELNNNQYMLLASDEGGPIMNHSAPPVNSDEAKLNRSLRAMSMVLLPALFLTYGMTMIGETMSGNSFIVNENLATDARIMHQMASVQQMVFRVTPDAVMLSSDPIHAKVMNAVDLTKTSAVAATNSATAAEAVEISDREKADSVFERQKLEQEILFQRHQRASALESGRQHWFSYAKSVILLGLGMALWGVLFRSMRMLQGSTLAGIAGLLLSINAYFLIFQI